MPQTIISDRKRIQLSSDNHKLAKWVIRVERVVNDEVPVKSFN